MIELAATSAVKDGKKLIYIYFRGQESKLYWSAGEPSDKGVRFSRPKPIAQSTKLDMRSSLALLPDEEGIVIYGIKKSGNGIEAFHDPFIYA
jgi:hypothetical protein